MKGKKFLCKQPRVAKKRVFYILDVAVGLTKTLSFVRFSFISALTPIAAKYSSRNILMKSFEVSETKTKV